MRQGVSWSNERSTPTTSISSNVQQGQCGIHIINELGGGRGKHETIVVADGEHQKIPPGENCPPALPFESCAVIAAGGWL